MANLANLNQALYKREELIEECIRIEIKFNELDMCFYVYMVDDLDDSVITSYNCPLSIDEMKDKCEILIEYLDTHEHIDGVYELVYRVLSSKTI